MARSNRNLQVARYENKVLQESLSNTQDAVHLRTTELKAARAALADMEEKKEVSDSLLGFARHVVKEKNAEIQQLRTQVENANSANEELHEQVRCIGLASANEATQIAGDISAKRSLNMLEGYRRGVAVRDERIRVYGVEVEDVRRQLAERDAKINEWENEVRLCSGTMSVFSDSFSCLALRCSTR